MTKSCMKQILGIDKEGCIGKYLGLTEYFGRLKKDLFSSIVDRIKNIYVLVFTVSLISRGTRDAQVSSLSHPDILYIT